MPLSNSQISSLLGLVANTSDDSLDCGSCFTRVSEFVDMHLAGKPLDESAKLIEQHLVNCPCCEDEFQALLDAMSAMSS